MGLLCNPRGKRSCKCTCIEGGSNNAENCSQQVCDCRQTTCTQPTVQTFECTCTCTPSQSETVCSAQPCICQPCCPQECSCSPAETQTVNCTCTCQADNSQSTPQPRPIRAMLNYVLDSCCITEDVCKDITLDIASVFDPGELCVGQMINIDIAGDISYKEISRRKDDCACLSTIRFTIPVRIYGNTGYGCGCKYIDRDICVIRSAKLCCTGDSQLTAFNTKVLAASAVISAIDCEGVTISLYLLFRSCLQQTILREFTLEAAPVCNWDNCIEARKQMNDPCDILCGCSESGIKTCSGCQ